MEWLFTAHAARRHPSFNRSYFIRQPLKSRAAPTEGWTMITARLREHKRLHLSFHRQQALVQYRIQATQLWASLRRSVRCAGTTPCACPIRIYQKASPLPLLRRTRPRPCYPSSKKCAPFSEHPLIWEMNLLLFSPPHFRGVCRVVFSFLFFLFRSRTPTPSSASGRVSPSRI